MSDEYLAILDAVDARGCGMRVAFCRCERRLAHRIGLVSSAAVQWILASVEGDAGDAWPPSPPLQQFAVSELDGGREAVLLLGMAARNHWSVSAESRPSERLIHFDVACRARVADPHQLHSVYQILGPWHLSASADTADLVGPGGSMRLAASLEADCRTTVRVKDGQLMVGPARPGGELTHRWRYEVTLTQLPGELDTACFSRP